MERLKVVNALLIGDNELECNCKDKTIDDINITMIGLNPDDLKKYNLILYSGSKGTKIIKSTYTKTGKVV
jgi:hypothetical protein